MVTLMWILVGVIVLSIGIGAWRLIMSSRQTKKALRELIAALKEVVAKLSDVAERVGKVAKTLEEINPE